MAGHTIKARDPCCTLRLGVVHENTPLIVSNASCCCKARRLLLVDSSHLDLPYLADVAIIETV